jgi:hypothetical protein
MSRSTLLLATAAGVFVMAGGFGTAAILGAINQTPTRTVTVTLAGGAQGPQGVAGPAGERGPVGPQGPPGGTACPSGFSPAVLVIDHPGGHVTLYACLKD